MANDHCLVGLHFNNVATPPDLGLIVEVGECVVVLSDDRMMAKAAH